MIEYTRYLKTCRSGGMADARDSKSREGNFMWVRLPPSAPESLFKAFYFFIKHAHKHARTQDKNKKGKPKTGLSFFNQKQ